MNITERKHYQLFKKNTPP